MPLVFRRILDCLLSFWTILIGHSIAYCCKSLLYQKCFLVADAKSFRSTGIYVPTPSRFCYTKKTAEAICQMVVNIFLSRIDIIDNIGRLKDDTCTGISEDLEYGGFNKNC